MGIPATRNWRYRPGSWDPLKTLTAIFAHSNRWGIPDLRRYDGPLPDWMVCCDEWQTKAAFKSDGLGAMHFFTDDYRFEPHWNKHTKLLSIVPRPGVVLTPDFSLWPEDPLTVQMYQTYRNRWLGAYWQSVGFNVIPTIGWGDERSWDFCFDGVPPGGPVAISTMGGTRKEADRKAYFPGYREMIRRLQPSVVLVFGTRFPPELRDGANVRTYECEWIKELRKRADKERTGGTQG